MKIQMILFMLLIALTPLISAEQICKIEGTNLLCNEIKNPSLWEKTSSYASQNPTTFWIIFLVLVILIILLLNYIFENKQSDRLVFIILALLLIILALFIIAILVVS